jgi:glutamyl/glutaminyl-tRNA synthetase
VFEALSWIGLEWDAVPGFTGIPRQSERSARYREALDQLVANGHAYRCTCSEAEVEACARVRRLGREAALRPHLPRARDRSGQRQAVLPALAPDVGDHALERLIRAAGEDVLSSTTS